MLKMEWGAAGHSDLGVGTVTRGETEGVMAQRVSVGGGREEEEKEEVREEVEEGTVEEWVEGWGVLMTRVDR